MLTDYVGYSKIIVVSQLLAAMYNTDVNFYKQYSVLVANLQNEVIYLQLSAEVCSVLFEEQIVWQQSEGQSLAFAAARKYGTLAVLSKLSAV